MTTNKLDVCTVLWYNPGKYTIYFTIKLEAMTVRASWRNVGRKIHYLRKEHQLTIKQLADGCNLSPNAISLIERGEVAPTVATLCKIASALGTSAAFFFQEICPNEIVLTRAGDHLRGQPTGDRQPSEREQSVGQSWQALTCAITPQGDRPASDIADLAGAKPTGQDTGDGQEPAPVYAPEFVLCLNGQIEYEADGQSYQLEKGDSISFNGGVLHCWRNPSSDTAVAVMVLHPQAMPELELEDFKLEGA